jgi:hypothetical protein
MRLAGLFIALTGCAQIFGLDTTTAASDGSAAASVTAEVERMSIGATVNTAPEDLTTDGSGDSLAFLVADPNGSGGLTSVPATQTTAGTWTAAIADGTPAADFTLQGQRQIWAFPTRDLKIADVHLEHPNPMAPDPSAALAVSVSLPSAVMAGEAFYIEEIGPWLSASIPGTNGATSVGDTLGIAAMTPATSAPPASVIPTDVVVVLRYLNAQLTGVFQAASFTETAGGNQVDGAMTAFSPDQTFGASIDQTAQNARFAAVRPAVGTPIYTWMVIAAPGAMRGIPSGPQLNAAALASTDTAIGASYGNPFASLGWSALVDYSASESRAVTVNGLSLTLQTTSTSLVVPSGTAMPTLDLPGALAQTISIDQQPLSTDNTTVMIDRTAPATLSLVVDRQSSIMYQAILYEVVPNDATTAKLSYVIEVLTNDPAKLQIPEDLLVVGHTYTVRVTCYADGFTGAATGDLLSSSPPFDYASTFSGVFTVTNP